MITIEGEKSMTQGKESEDRESTPANETNELEDGFVTVHVIHVNEVERTHFKEKRDATLREVWATSYTKLEIERKPKDIFQTGGDHPVSLMNHLDLTLEQASREKVIHNFHFGIASEHGGALGGYR